MSTIKSFGKTILALEVAAFVGLYAFYRKTNRDPEFRFLLATRPGGHEVLELYYQLGETLNPELKIRESDIRLWREQGKIN